MTTQQILIAVLTFFGGGSLVSLIGFLVYRKRTKAETTKTLAEAKNLEAQATSTIATATSEIINKFRELLDESEERCKERIEGLENDVCTIKENYNKLKKAYDEIKSEYALLLSWAKSVSEILQDRNIPYPDPPHKVQTVIPKNGESHTGYKL
jgi:archaellum component FlaC